MLSENTKRLGRLLRSSGSRSLRRERASRSILSTSSRRGRRTPAAYIITAMQAAIEAQGIRFLFDDTGAPAGVARRDVRIDLSEAGADQSGG